MAQSRQPHFYADWAVPDTVTGRFDMISLHMALLFRRLRAEGGAGKNFSQAVFDLFFKVYCPATCLKMARARMFGPWLLI